MWIKLDTVILSQVNNRLDLEYLTKLVNNVTFKNNNDLTLYQIKWLIKFKAEKSFKLRIILQIIK